MDEKPIKERTTADLLHDLKKIKRMLSEHRETLIKMKIRIRELEGKEDLLCNELDRRGE